MKIKNTKIHISFSEFSLFKECAHRHLIEKHLSLVQQPPSIHLFFGTAIHSAIEYGLSHNYNLNQRIDHFKKMFYDDMVNNLKDSKEYELVNDFIDQGIHMLQKILTEKVLKKYDLIGVEYPLYEQIFGIYHFKGFIDLIVRDKKTGKVVIIDWKTSGEAWNVTKKMTDKTFLTQMMFYKYFYARKENVPFEEIECKYVVLNRLVNKKKPELGYGELQTVEMKFEEKDMEEAIELLTITLNQIYIKREFLKAKMLNREDNCFFCSYKYKKEWCDSNPEQYKVFLKEHDNKNNSDQLI